MHFFVQNAIIQEVTKLLRLTAYNEIFLYIHDTVHFKIKLQTISTGSNAVLLSTQINQAQEILKCQTTGNVRKSHHSGALE